MQDVSITVLNVTLNDSGIYTCNITREFEFEIHRPLFQSSRLIHLTVVEEGRKGCQKVLCAVTGRGCCHPGGRVCHCTAGEGSELVSDKRGAQEGKPVPCLMAGGSFRAQAGCV